MNNSTNGKYVCQIGEFAARRMEIAVYAHVPTYNPRPRPDYCMVSALTSIGSATALSVRYACRDVAQLNNKWTMFF